MPSLKETRNRVRSVKNTQKITRAMKLVAAAKLRRAQDAVVQARPYSNLMKSTLAQLVPCVEDASHPLFEAQEAPRKALLVPITSDRGLCGGFNATVIRRSAAFLRDQKDGYEEITVSAIGRKGISFAKREELPSVADLNDERLDTQRDSARAIARQLTRLFVETDVDAVFLVFNQFVSALTQEIVVQQLLPLSTESFEAPEGEVSEFIFEPDQETLLESLLPRYIESQVLLALLESEASELGARMTAMDNATSNASDLIDRLTLQLNRARQAIITTELMEITSGAEALKG